MPKVVYVNGRMIPYEQATLPLEDRGTLFADGIYEVIRFYSGTPFFMDAHLDRLAVSSQKIALPPIDIGELKSAAMALARENDIHDGSLYIQVTRGVARRTHAFPEHPEPTRFMILREVPRPDRDLVQAGIDCISAPDVRWLRCDIKSTALLPNVMAKEQARQAGAYEAVLIRDGVMIEGSSSNLFGVKDGTLYTYPDGPLILAGVTRRIILALAEEDGIPIRFEPLRHDDFDALDEMFISGTISEILGVAALDARPVGDGKVGPITRHLTDRYDGLVEQARQGLHVDVADECITVRETA